MQAPMRKERKAQGKVEVKNCREALVALHRFRWTGPQGIPHDPASAKPWSPDGRGDSLLIPNQVNRWLTFAANAGVLAGLIVLIMEIRQGSAAAGAQFYLQQNGGRPALWTFAIRRLRYVKGPPTALIHPLQLLRSD